MTTPLEPVLRHAIAENPRYLEKLCDLIKIPSISFSGFPPEPLTEAAKTIEILFSSLPGVNVKTLDGAGPAPALLITAQPQDTPETKNLPTLLFYAHYDVQPPMRENLWNTPPFEGVIKGPRLYGRGAADDKAGVILHYALLKSYIESLGSVPLPIKILLEGEEEIGSPHLDELISRYSEELKADCVVIADCTNHQTGLPSLTTSLRGLVSFDLKLESMTAPLHSGMWGGPLPDPALALCQLISTLADTEGNLIPPSLVSLIPPLDESILSELKRIPHDDEEFCKQAGLLTGVPLRYQGFEILKALWWQPALVVSAFEAGMGKKTGNVLLPSAWCRLGLRIPPKMDPDKTCEALLEHLRKCVPAGLHLSIENIHTAPGWETPIKHPIFELITEALQKGYNQSPLYIGCGGSIPFVNKLCTALGGVPALLTGLEDPETLAHSENESLFIPDFLKALKSQIIFTGFMADQKGIFSQSASK